MSAEKVPELLQLALDQRVIDVENRREETSDRQKNLAALYDDITALVRRKTLYVEKRFWGIYTVETRKHRVGEAEGLETIWAQFSHKREFLLGRLWKDAVRVDLDGWEEYFTASQDGGAWIRAYRADYQQDQPIRIATARDILQYQDLLKYFTQPPTDNKSL